MTTKDKYQHLRTAKGHVVRTRLMRRGGKAKVLPKSKRRVPKWWRRPSLALIGEQVTRKVLRAMRRGWRSAP